MAHTKKHTLFSTGCAFLCGGWQLRDLCVLGMAPKDATRIFWDLRSFWVFEQSVYIMAEKKEKVSFYGGMWWITMTC
jgi:hypothetical protein